MSFQKKEQRAQSKRNERTFLKNIEKGKIDKIARHYNKKIKTKAIAEARDRKQIMVSFDFGNDQEYIRPDPTAHNFWHKEVEEKSAVKSQMKESIELYRKIVSYMDPKETICDWDDAFNNAVTCFYEIEKQNKIKELYIREQFYETLKQREQEKKMKEHRMKSDHHLIFKDGYP